MTDFEVKPAEDKTWDRSIAKDCRQNGSSRQVL
jgi:hypothetical protein